MFDEVQVEASYNKFRNYLISTINELEKKRKLNDVLDNLDKIVGDYSIKNVIANKETFLVLCPEVSKYYDVIDFFASKGVLGTPQIDIACSSIIKKIKGVDLSKVDASEEISKYQRILEEDYIEVDTLSDVLDESNLTEREKIEVLARNCYLNLPDVKSIDRKRPIDKLNERYMVVLPVILDIQKKYGFLVSGKNNSQIAYALELGEMYENRQIGFKQMIDSLKELVVSYYLTIEKRNSEAKELINKSENGKLPLSEVDILSETMDLLEHDIITFDYLIKVAHENKINIDGEEGVYLER